MTEGQAQATLSQLGAVFRANKGSVAWWKAADGSWLAVTKGFFGDVKIQKLPANACNCG